MGYVWKNFIVMWLLVFAGFTIVVCYRAFFTNSESLDFGEFITTTESAHEEKSFPSRGDLLHSNNLIM